MSGLKGSPNIPPEPDWTKIDAVDAARAAAPSEEPRKPCGHRGDCEHGDGKVLIGPDPHPEPAPDRAGLREAIAATLESWGVGDMVRDRTPELVAELAAIAAPAPLDVERPFIVRQFDGQMWVPLREAAEQHANLERLGLANAALRNENLALAARLAAPDEETGG